MKLIYFLFFLSLIVIWLPWLWRYQWQPRLAKKNLDRVLKAYPQGQALGQVVALLNTLYRGVHAKSLSQRERRRLGLQDDAFIYGEVDFLSFILLLEKVKPQAGEVFYDLGSGSGRAVFTAALGYDFSKACGIELLDSLCRLAKVQINKAKTLIFLNKNKKNRERYLSRLASIHFIQDNFLHCEISDADLVFINATCFSYSIWEALIEKLKKLKVGSRIITTSKKIQAEQFELVYETKELMSWGMNSVYIYKKIEL